jgi:hypothetical protein
MSFNEASRGEKQTSWHFGGADIQWSRLFLIGPTCGADGWVLHLAPLRCLSSIPTSFLRIILISNPLCRCTGLLDRNFLSSNPTWGRSGGWKWVWHRYPACCRRFWPYCGYERVQYFLGYVPVSPLIFFFFRFFPRYFWTLLTSSIAKVWKCDWFPDFSLKKFE